MPASGETRARTRVKGDGDGRDRGRPVVRVRGKVREALPGAVFRVDLEKGERVLAHMGEELRLHAVRLIPGDRVLLELSPRDLARGRIVERL